MKSLPRLRWSYRIVYESPLPECRSGVWARRAWLKVTLDITRLLCGEGNISWNTIATTTVILYKLPGIDCDLRMRMLTLLCGYANPMYIQFSDNSIRVKEQEAQAWLYGLVVNTSLSWAGKASAERHKTLQLRNNLSFHVVNCQFICSRSNDKRHRYRIISGFESSNWHSPQIRCRCL